jgi:hypothetical protein
MRYYGVACGQFRFFLRAQGADRALPGESPVTGAARHPDPQLFSRVRTGQEPFCTSDPHGCAQQTGKKFSCRAGRRSGPGCRCWREAAGTPDADRARAWMTWMTLPTKAGTGCSPHARQDRRPAYPAAYPSGHAHPACRHARLRYAQAARAQSLPTLVPPPSFPGGRPVSMIQRCEADDPNHHALRELRSQALLI